MHDPASYVRNTDTVQQSITQRSVSGEGDIQPGDSPISNNVDQTMINMQEELLVPQDKLSLLTNNQKAAIAAELDQMPFQQQIAEVENLINQHDPFYHHILMRDLKGAGVKAAHEMVLNAQYGGIPDTLKEIPMMMQAFSEPLADILKSAPADIERNEIKADIQDSLTEYQATLANYKAPTEIEMGQLLDDMNHYALFLMARKGISQDQAVARATNMVNGVYSFEDFNGTSYRVPIWVSTADDAPAEKLEML